MKLGVLFSGGKDSMYAAYIAKKEGYKLACLISVESSNKESFMFHTPSLSQVKKHGEVMKLPVILQKTKGDKEIELEDLKKAIKKAIRDYKIEGIVTGAVESVYQATRVQKICNELNIECFNPLWQKSQFELLNDLIRNKFEVILTGVFAYPFNQAWLGRKIDREFIQEIVTLHQRYRINPAGEGGEYESLVLNCPLFSRRLEVKEKEDFGSGNSWRREVVLK